jgi:restriction endonuclease Mrr
LVTTGQVLSGAREEASLSGAAPITLVDGAKLARLCEERGVGVLRTQVAVPTVDANFFEALRGQ